MGIRQNFRLWFVPGYCADVSLTTVLTLTDDPYPHIHESEARTVFARDNERDIKIRGEEQQQQEREGREKTELVKKDSSSTTDIASNGISGSGIGNGKRYWIQSQNDLYQTSEWIKFLVPWGIGWRLVVLWQFFATFMCVVGAIALFPFTLLLERALGGNGERVASGEILGKD